MYLLNGEIYIFFVVFFLALIVIAVFDIIEPEDEIVKNFVPFPDIKPSNLPGPTEILSSSYYPSRHK
jgi:hypothetical protein